MKYFIEILDSEHNIIDTKFAYTINEIATFYKEEYKRYCYRVYEIKDIDLWQVGDKE